MFTISRDDPAKKITPKKSSTPSRQLRMIHPTLSATASRYQANAQDRKKRSSCGGSDSHGVRRILPRRPLVSGKVAI